jgi:RimJ/RimL family protein N-acetyltransferase
MIEELPVDRIARYREYFPGPQPQMVVASVAEGNTGGHLWVDVQPKGETVALLWDKGNNVYYWGGRFGGEEDARAWASLIRGPVKVRATQERLARFKVRALSPLLERVIPALFEGVALSEYRELFFGFRKERPAVVPSPAIAGVVFGLIDRELLGREDLRNLEYVRSEIRWMWPSEERFYERGFGVVALLADEAIGWCTAEYVSHEQCGIGIEVMEGYENRGVATAMAARFAEECLRRGIQPHWECGGGNLGSIRVAEKVGFERSEEATFWAGVFRE